MMKMAYRIKTLPVYSAIYGKEEFDDRFDVKSILEICEKIPAAMKINSQNVFDFFFNKLTDNEKLSFSQDVPNWAPPFGEFFVEYLYTSSMTQFGVFLSVEENPRVIYFPDDDKNVNAEWGIVGYVFASFLKESQFKLASGIPIFIGSFCVNVDVKGNYIHAFVHKNIPIDAPEREEIKHAMATVGMTISFMHCKNVIQKSEKIENSPRWHKQYSEKRYTYKTLSIEPMKTVLRKEGKSEETGLRKALHICRGHFSTYSDDKPLFGKYPGTFWVPDHVRGSKDVGEVVKDYDVKTPK